MVSRKRSMLAMFAMAATLLSAVAVTPAWAILVRPILIQLSATGQGSSSQIQVVNDRNRPITVEISVNRLGVPEVGPVTQDADSGDEFLIFPPRATIQPGATQVFRVRWVGDPDIPEAKSYMFSSSELPIGFEPGTTGIQMLYSIQSVVTVSPARGESNLSVASVERAVAPTGEVGLNVMFANQGNDVALLSKASVELKSAGWTRALTSTNVAERVGIGLVPPNSRRQLFLPVDDLPAEGEITATVDLNPDA